MKISEMIKRLEDLRAVVGYDAPVVISRHDTKCVDEEFELACAEVQNCVEYDGEWVSRRGREKLESVQVIKVY